MQTQARLIYIALLAAISSSGFMSLIIFLIQRADRHKDKMKDKDTVESKMLLGLGHDKIIYLTDRFVRRGAITLKEKRNLEFLYKPYVGLGGNGDCEIGYEACKKLPVISEEEAVKLDAIYKRKEYGFEVNE